LLHLVGSSVLLYLIDDARSNTNQKYFLINTAVVAAIRDVIHTSLNMIGAANKKCGRCSSV